MRLGLRSILLSAVLVLGLAPSVLAASTIQAVQDRGYLRCGVTDRVPGFSVHDTDGTWRGFFIDFCRAGAAAVLGNADAVKVESYWLDALEGGSVDVLHAGSTWTFSRDTANKVDFASVYFYDGQGFIAHTAVGASDLEQAKGLKGLRVCAIENTSTAANNLKDFVEREQIDWTVVPIQTMDGMWRAFFGGRCDLALHDRSALAAIHAGRLQDSGDFIVFPEVISKEPLAPAVREDDAQWRDLITWVTMVTIAAEDLGVSSKNVDEMRATSQTPEIQRLLGVTPGMGEPFSLEDSWAYNVIKTVGNYREIFERNLGPDTPFNMARGLNALWRDGGLLYPLPLR